MMKGTDDRYICAEMDTGWVRVHTRRKSGKIKKDLWRSNWWWWWRKREREREEEEVEERDRYRGEKEEAKD